MKFIKKLKTFLDKASTFVAAVLCAAMMVVLLANVILRFVPGVGGFKWYMEGGQFLNVFSMMIAGIGITASRTHLHVELVDSMVANNPTLKKIHIIIVSLFQILFYAMVTYGGYLAATSAAAVKRTVSTMPQFTMGQVYWIFPIAGGITVLGAVIDLIVKLADKEEKGGKEK